MKRLAIYFSSPGAMDYPFNKEIFYESYCEVIDSLEKKGIEVAVVRANSYLGKGIWKPWFKKVDNEFIQQSGAFKSDLIWNRDDKNTFPDIHDAPVLNEIEFDRLCRDKLKTAKLFKKLSAKTFLIKKFEDLKLKITSITTSKIVLKPRFGEQAKGVYVLDRREINSELYPSWENILLQEFLDSSEGIKNLVSGIHEIQICVVNGNFASARLKDYPKGVYVASATGKGTRAKVKSLDQNQLPPDLWKIVEAMDEKLTQFYPRIYRADFVNTKDGFKLMELNSRPGIGHPKKEGKTYWRFNQKVIEAIEGFLKSKR